MKLFDAYALCLIFFSLASLARAEDWTTTDGKTYHNVVERYHNNQDVTIFCQEGQVTIPLAVLPEEIQTRYHYDAKREAAMNVYLIRIGPKSAPDELHHYALQLKQLVLTPTTLGVLTPEEIVWLRQNRLIAGGYLAYKFSKDDALDLRNDETKLIGLMLMAIEAKLDPAFDASRLYFINDSSPAGEEARQQMEIKHFMGNFIASGKYYLKVLYGHQRDGVSVDAEARPVMIEAGVDPKSIDYLVGKTEFKD